MDENRRHDRHNSKIRDLIAFWIFGLCNNYGYVVMLTAAEDILSSKSVINTNNQLMNKNKFS
jgi:hypothetical protein